MAGGEISCLSACSTAEDRHTELVDEVLHVVRGFRVADFRHVVGYLSSSDSVCANVAESLYPELGELGMIKLLRRQYIKQR